MTVSLTNIKGDRVDFDGSDVDFSGASSLTLGTVSGATTMNEDLTLSEDTPRLYLVDTNAPTNEKHWIQSLNAGSWQLSPASEATPTTPTNTAINIQRTGTTVDEIELNATDIDINGNVDISGTLEASSISFDGGTNTLDAYEEGTWTPTIFGSTIEGVNGYSTQDGNYTLVGDLCYVDFDVQLNGTFTSTGNLRIGGLPFNCANSNGYVNISFSGGNLGLMTTPISAATTTSSNHLRLQHYATNTATSGLANTEVSNTFRASGHIVYKIA